LEFGRQADTLYYIVRRECVAHAGRLPGAVTGAEQVKFIKQGVVGTLLVAGERAALRLAEGDEPVVYLAFALTTQGIAAQIIPSVLLDDWGKEIKGLALYEWVHEHGLRFPRAELFGFSPDGQSIQYFLRDMELFAPVVAYATVDKTLPIEQWSRLTEGLVPALDVIAPEPTGVPDDVTGPLREARLGWWRVSPGFNTSELLKLPATV
jgi:hypothetical protein